MVYARMKKSFKTSDEERKSAVVTNASNRGLERDTWHGLGKQANYFFFLCFKIIIIMKLLFTFSLSDNPLV